MRNTQAFTILNEFYVYVYLEIENEAPLVNNMASSLVDVTWNFAKVDAFCVESGSKHAAKGYKYFAEKYIHDVNGKHSAVVRQCRKTLPPHRFPFGTVRLNMPPKTPSVRVRLNHDGTAYADGTASLVADGTDYKDGTSIQLLVEQTEQPIQTRQPFVEQTGQPLYRRDSYVDV